MRHIVRNALIVLLVTIFAALLVFPPEKNLRKGKDIAGGVTLVYTVDLKPTENAGAVMDEVINVLKKRVDPNGVLEISMVKTGVDRIEITMPLPSDRVKRLRAEFEAELSKLTASWVNADDVEQVLSLPPDQREQRISELTPPGDARRDLLVKAAQAHDLAASTGRAYDELQKPVDEARAALAAIPPDAEGADKTARELLQLAVDKAEADLTKAAAAAAVAELEYGKARSAVLADVVSRREVMTVLQRSNQKTKLVNAQGEVVPQPSPRERGWQRLKELHPGSLARFDAAMVKWVAYEGERKSLDDPSDLRRLLKGAGVLNFRTTIRTGTLSEEAATRDQLRKVGPRNASLKTARWFKINKIENWYTKVEQEQRLRENPALYFASSYGAVAEEYDGEFYMLCSTAKGTSLTEEDGDWSLNYAGPDHDEYGRPCIRFGMDNRGADKLGRLTESNVNSQMAVILDDEVYTAPTIQSRISSTGTITGNFSEKELRYIINVLAAGSLQAKLSPEPISQQTITPDLGADNLNRGLNAGLISFIAVSAFMIVYYFGCGVISVIALLFNALFLVGTMSLIEAAFTLPGIAGIALTFGMAVDANVLIFERMREELERGEDLRTATRLGHEKALAAIVDGNLTNLIACVVLGFTGTPEIRGFAITLGIGVLTTLFAQLFFARFIFDIFIERFGWRRASMLPMAVPAIRRALTPNIDWMSLRHFFYAFSIALTLLGVVMVAVKGSDLLDSEFRGGISATIELKTDAAGKPVTLTRKEVEDRVRAIAATNPALHELSSASIQVIDSADGLTSNRFKIKSLLTDTRLVQDAIVTAFNDVISSQPALTFKANTVKEAREAPAFPILKPVLGESIGRPELRNDVSEYIGGVAIVLADLQPTPRLADLEARLRQARSRAENSDLAARQTRFVVLEGSDAAVKSAVLLVRDDSASFFENQSQWVKGLRDREWKLITSAIGESTTLASVESFSPAIARTFKAQAAVAILLSVLLIVIYIWVRFNSLRYSLAAIIATLHDCFAAIGMISIAGTICEAFPSFAASINLLPFKFDLNSVAAILTILGYSLNDSIIVMDRIRENRGKLPYASRELVNRSINQTISRTLITSGTTLVSALVLYMWGGEGVRQFSFALLVGIFAGTYSSIGVAAPIVWSRAHDEKKNPVTPALPTAGAPA